MTGPTRVEPASVAERLADVRARMARSAARSGRPPDAVRLVAVSKSFSAARVLEAVGAGHRDFGESRVQELRKKAPAVGADVSWHFVGPLQRNKAKHLVGLAALIHSIDREDLAGEVARRASRAGHVQPVLVQVNVGEDPAKAGFALDELDGVVERVRGLDGLRCEGLMTIPPMHAEPGPLFARLREARDAITARFPEVRHLSMGMSRDFEVAVEEGATIVRLGEAVFGARPQPA